MIYRDRLSKRCGDRCDGDLQTAGTDACESAADGDYQRVQVGRTLGTGYESGVRAYHEGRSEGRGCT